MRKEEVTLEVFKQYIELIGYKLIQREEEPKYDIVDNLGNKLEGFEVDNEQLEIDVQGLQICFFFDDCWIETSDNDCISLTGKRDNSGIFINITKKK